MCEAAERFLIDGIRSVAESQLNTRLSQNVISEQFQVVFTTVRAEEQREETTRCLQQ